MEAADQLLAPLDDPRLEIRPQEADVPSDLQVRDPPRTHGLVDPARLDREQLSHPGCMLALFVRLDDVGVSDSAEPRQVMARSTSGFFASNLKRERERQGLSMRELGRFMAGSEISRMESDSDPRLSTMPRVAHGLGVPVADLLQDVERAPSRRRKK